MDSTVVIFTKAPIPGLVKTRLTQNTCLTKLDAAKLAKAMLKDTICLASKTDADLIQIGYFPEENLSMLKEITDTLRAEGYLNKRIELICQRGSNFDQRFGSVVKESFKSNTKFTVVLGADLPFLDPKIINKALEILAKKIDEKPIVIGPSSGGGIYLVGITKEFNPRWFSDYKLFGGGLELSKFTHFCIDNKVPLITLPPYGDIDIEEDLVSLISYINVLKNSEETIGFYFPYFTTKIIEELELYIIEDQDQTRNRKIAKKNIN
ncbi:MAG: TIGR04282 family arsenosugar biosynthesis glycosyltransferase [Promethearchaeota archaeon]|jgi:glycosyltransferase A (GT-A) superfamily protein (DUF2064 family)